MPELRGEIISGTLFSKKTNKAAFNENIAISIPQNDFILKVTTSDKQGRFYFNLLETYDVNKGAVQVLDKEKKDFNIVLDKDLPISVSDFVFGDFKISKAYKNSIIERNIYNQIENSYGAYKRDSIIKNKKIIPFFEKYTETYNLDDFTRFSSLKETFIEIIQDAGIKREENKDVFYVNSLNPYLRSQKSIAIIVDGILQQNYEKLISYNARKIKSISVVRDETQFILGSKKYDGFIVFKTFQGNYNNNISLDDSFKRIQLFSPQQQKKYFNVNYSKSNIDHTKRIPDFRRQLLWMPSVNLLKEEKKVEFFASDNTGIYEICIEGFTKNGDAITLKEYFRIK